MSKCEFQPTLICKQQIIVDKLQIGEVIFNH